MPRPLPYLLAATALSATACNQPDRAKAKQNEKVDAPAIAEEPKAEEPGPKFVAVGDGDVAPLILKQLATAGTEERDVLVYVGADWCKPCVRFHEAVAAGQLDAAFPTLTLVEFDAENDKTRLDAAGYGSRMVPLFAAPGPDGTGSGRRFEGSTESRGAVEENILPRLEKLVEISRSDRATWGRGQGG